MYNMLIVEDEMLQSQFLINAIAKEISDVRIYNIATTGLDAIHTMENEDIDIILLDLKLPDMTGMDIINYIDKNNIKGYNSSIIIVTAEMSLLNQAIKSPYVYAYNSKIYGAEPIIENIKCWILDKKENNKNKILMKSINDELSKLKYNFTYVGTKYLAECIYEAYHMPNKYDVNLKKDIYPILSQKYHKSINSIKCNINQATSIMYYDIEENILSAFFNYELNCKPKPKDIILKIIEYIDKEM